MTGEKITLRLKSDHAVVLPEAVLVSEGTGVYVIDFDPRGSASRNPFAKRDWEPVPPPYVLPTGIGAVVRSDTGLVFIRFSQNLWLIKSGAQFEDTGVLSEAPLTTLSEGVDL